MKFWKHHAKLGKQKDKGNIEIDSIEELMNFIDKNGGSVVITHCASGWDLLIYDDCIE